MEQAYLIIEPNVRLADIVRAIYFYRWDWKGEVDETANAPYTRLYIDQSGVRIFYREEHKDIFSARYFYVEGDKIAPALEKLRAAAGHPLDADAHAAFQRALADPAPGVRIAAIWCIAWAQLARAPHAGAAGRQRRRVAHAARPDHRREGHALNPALPSAYPRLTARLPPRYLHLPERDALQARGRSRRGRAIAPT